MDIIINLNNYIITDTFYNRRASRAIIKSKYNYLLLEGKEGDFKFPGGGVEENEDFIMALIREVREETGADVISASIREAFGIYEKRISDDCEKTIMYSKYYFCEIESENITDGKWINLQKAYENNRRFSDYNKIPWLIREKEAMKYLISMEKNCK